MPWMDVVEFNEEILGIRNRKKGLLNESELRITEEALCEEVGELIQAHESGDYLGAVDALIDNIYFAIGALHKLGVTPDEMRACFKVVHQCNMTKHFGRKDGRGDGLAADAIKPEGWSGPEEQLGEILNGG